MLVPGEHFVVSQEFNPVYFQSMVSGSEDEPYPAELLKIRGKNGPFQVTPFRGYRRGSPVSYN